MNTYANDSDGNTPAADPTDNLLTVWDVAQFAGISMETVGYHIRTGGLKAYKLGTIWVIQIDDAFDWIKGREYR